MLRIPHRILLCSAVVVVDSTTDFTHIHLALPFANWNEDWITDADHKLWLWPRPVFWVKNQQYVQHTMLYDTQPHSDNWTILSTNCFFSYSSAIASFESPTAIGQNLSSVAPSKTQSQNLQLIDCVYWKLTNVLPLTIYCAVNEVYSMVCSRVKPKQANAFYFNLNILKWTTNEMAFIFFHLLVGFWSRRRC